MVSSPTGQDAIRRARALLAEARLQLDGSDEDSVGDEVGLRETSQESHKPEEAASSGGDECPAEQGSDDGSVTPVSHLRHTRRHRPDGKRGERLENTESLQGASSSHAGPSSRTIRRSTCAQTIGQQAAGAGKEPDPWAHGNVEAPALRSGSPESHTSDDEASNEAVQTGVSKEAVQTGSSTNQSTHKASHTHFVGSGIPLRQNPYDAQVKARARQVRSSGEGRRGEK